MGGILLANGLQNIAVIAGFCEGIAKGAKKRAGNG
jgi:hypothetical protein